MKRARGATRFGWIATVALVLVAATGHAQEIARLRFDLEAATLDVSTSGGVRHFTLVEGLRGRLDQFRAGLAAGRWSREDAAALGRDLLGPASEALATSTVWEVTPLDVAPLAALVAPWDGERPLVHHVVLWYRPAGLEPSAAGETAAPRPGQEEGVLAVMPFQPGLDPHVDSGDTMLAAFRAGSRTVDLVPRNDTTAPTIAGTLQDHRYSLLWVRASREGIEPLLAPLSTGPNLMWWSRPGRGPRDASVDDAVAVVTRWSAGGKTALFDLWPRAETPAARGARAWTRSVARGDDLATALARARRELADVPGMPVAAWAGWILVGDGRRTLSWREPTWLQRLLRRGNENSR